MTRSAIRPIQFLTVVLISAAIMFGLSYVWHGVLLNDYVNIRIPMWLYFLLSSIVYVLIALVISILFRFTYIPDAKHRGLLIGASLGFFIYMIAFVLGVSFSQSSVSHIAVDFVWQMIEQGVGGVSVGLCYRLISDYERAKILNQ